MDPKPKNVQLHEQPIVDDVPKKIEVQAPPPQKVKKSQLGNLEMIRMITMMIHFQEKDLGLKLTGDQILEKDVDKSNHLEIQKNWMNSYVGQNHATNP